MQQAVDAEIGDQYGTFVAYGFVFNLILGSGPLTLPFAFHKAGMLLASGFVLLVAGAAFIAATYIVESMSLAAAFARGEEGVPLIVNAAEVDPVAVFALDSRQELGTMAARFFPRAGHLASIACVVLYLYGGATMYAVSVPQAVMAVSGNIGSLGEGGTYHVLLACFAALGVPLCFHDFQKTKPLQIFTVITRSIVFVTMLTLSFVRVARGAGDADVSLLQPSGMSHLFEVAVFVFMCHHSLPGILAPVRNKRTLVPMLVAAYGTVFVAYVLLCLFAQLAFGGTAAATCGTGPGAACEIQALYTSNFASYDVHAIGSTIALFPVLLIDSFPLVVISLRNNLMQLLPIGRAGSTLRQVAFTLVAALPPIAIASVTRDVQMVTAYTGAYAGMAILFLIPTALVTLGRKRATERWGHDAVARNPLRSPAGHVAWSILIVSFAAVAIVFNTVNFIRGEK